MAKDKPQFPSFAERTADLDAEHSLGHYIVWLNLARSDLKERKYKEADAKLLEVLTAMTKLDNENAERVWHNPQP